MFFVFGSWETGCRLLVRALFYIMAYPLGAFKLSWRSITFSKLSSLPFFNIMLPWEEDLDEGFKTFLLRQACGPPSIFLYQQTRLCSMDRLCTAILKRENLPFLPHWEKGILETSWQLSRLPGQKYPKWQWTLKLYVVCNEARSDNFFTNLDGRQYMCSIHLFMKM